MFTNSTKNADLAVYSTSFKTWRVEPKTEAGLTLLITEGFLPDTACLNTPREISEYHAKMLGLIGLSLDYVSIYMPERQPIKYA